MTTALIQALSRLAGNRQADGTSSLVSGEDRKTIIDGCYDLMMAARQSAGSAPETCVRCQGNGEIVTDWDRYRHPHPGDNGDEAVAECPDCGGEGIIDCAAAPAATGASSADGDKNGG